MSTCSASSGGLWPRQEGFKSLIYPGSPNDRVFPILSFRSLPVSAKWKPFSCLPRGQNNGFLDPYPREERLTEDFQPTMRIDTGLYRIRRSGKWLNFTRSFYASPRVNLFRHFWKTLPKIKVNFRYRKGIEDLSCFSGSFSRLARMW